MVTVGAVVLEIWDGKMRRIQNDLLVVIVAQATYITQKTNISQSILKAPLGAFLVYSG